MQTVFENHKVPLFADAGTLLGAVREGGFIKNDRDVDLLSFDAFEYTIEMEIRPEINEKCGGE